MNGAPRWHGWATPDQVREMIFEMKQFLRKNGEWDIPKSVKITPQGTYEFQHLHRKHEEILDADL